MGRRHAQYFFKEDIQMANRHERMLSITHHQGNTNQNHNEIPPHTHQKWLKLTTQETKDIGEDAEKGEPSNTVGGNANWCSHYGKQYGGSSKSEK